MKLDEITDGGSLKDRTWKHSSVQGADRQKETAQNMEKELPTKAKESQERLETSEGM